MADKNDQHKGRSPSIYTTYMSTTYRHLTATNLEFQFADVTALWAASEHVQFAAIRLRKDLRKLAKWIVKWKIKLNPEN